MVKIKEMTGKNTSEHTFLVCGNERCDEFFGCKNPSGTLRLCGVCGFHQKMCCAQTLDVLIDQKKFEQVTSWTDSCDYCPPDPSSIDKISSPAFMSDECE